MKNFIAFLLLLTVTRYYSQNESFTLQYNEFFTIQKHADNFLNQNHQSNLEEIIFFEPFFIKSNSDGKFLKYAFNDEAMNSLEATNLNEINSSSIKSKSVFVVLKSDFINEVTLQLLEKEIVKFDRNKAYFKHDKNIALDKLNKTIYDKEITIQIGNSITKYLNKLHKSDLDKTFVNELNLLVINF